METFYGLIFAGVIAVQSSVCLINACYTGERLDKLERRLKNISNVAALRIERIERSQILSNYYPPGPYVPPSVPHCAPPTPSAPMGTESQPKHTGYSY